MSQSEILTFLKTNTGKFYSVEQISSECNINRRIVFKNIKSLRTDPHIQTKIADLGGQRGKVTLFTYNNIAALADIDDFKKNLILYHVKRHENMDSHPETVMQTLILTELQKISSLLEGKKDGGHQHEVSN